MHSADRSNDPLWYLDGWGVVSSTSFPLPWVCLHSAEIILRPETRLLWIISSWLTNYLGLVFYCNVYRHNCYLHKLMLRTNLSELRWKRGHVKESGKIMNCVFEVLIVSIRPGILAPHSRPMVFRTTMFSWWIWASGFCCACTQRDAIGMNGSDTKTFAKPSWTSSPK